MTALERAARALWEDREKRFPTRVRRAPDAQDEITGAWQHCLADARAVLQAIREPDEGMVEAGRAKLDDRYDATVFPEFDAQDAWRAMIDHILDGE